MNPPGLARPALLGCLAAVACWYAAGRAAEPDAHKFDPPEDKGYQWYPLQIMNRSTFEAYNFEPGQDKAATVSYTVSKTGWVRIRIVRRDDRDLLLRTLQDWTRSDFGTTYRAQWDGTDASGNPIDPGEIFIVFDGREPMDETLSDEAIRRDPVLAIVEPPARQTVSERSDIVAVLTDLPLGAEGPTVYDARLYIDYELAQSLSVPGNQQRYTFPVDPGRLEDGDHIFTVNLDDRRDRVGAASIILTVRN